MRTQMSILSLKLLLLDQDKVSLSSAKLLIFRSTPTSVTNNNKFRREREQVLSIIVVLSILYIQIDCGKKCMKTELHETYLGYHLLYKISSNKPPNLEKNFNFPTLM